MDSRYRFLTSGIPSTQSMPSRDVNAATRLAETSWRPDNVCKRDGNTDRQTDDPITRFPRWTFQAGIIIKMGAKMSIFINKFCSVQ